MALVVDCLKNFSVAQNRLYYEIQQDYEELLQVLEKRLKISEEELDYLDYLTAR